MRALARGVACAAVAVLAVGCGLPSEGARTVDDVTVPYHLLDDRPSPQGDQPGSVSGANELVVFWVDDDGLLIPRAASDTCPLDVATLLDELSAGPTQEVRDRGLATALPPDATLELVATADDLVVVDLGTDTQVRADRLPVAIGQVVLTLTSTPEIRRVSLLSNGERVQLPDADGVLTATPVTAAAYKSLVPPSFWGSSPFRGGGTDDPRCPGGT